ncbi:hypothetical protein SDC9_193583 [bioreactor metagenome]|uniref:Uncharacterized protein n=1 Tax=bioreactor metagenome TaxID=1076179 RepID=A0A645ICI4_9ZZZZ
MPAPDGWLRQKLRNCHSAKPFIRLCGSCAKCKVFASPSRSITHRDRIVQGLPIGFSPAKRSATRDNPAWLSAARLGSFSPACLQSRAAALLSLRCPMICMTSCNGISCADIVAALTSPTACGSVNIESNASRSLISGRSKRLPRCSTGIPLASRPSAMSLKRALDAQSSA